MTRKETWSCCGIRALIVAGSLLAASLYAADEEFTQIRQQLVAQGIAVKTAERLTAALEKAAESEKLGPLLPFLQSTEPVVVIAAAGFAIVIDEDAGRREVIRLLTKKNANSPALLIALSSSYHRETVDLLIKEVATAKTSERKEAALFALRVVTGQPHTEAADWQAWWKAHRNDFAATVPEDSEEQERRMRGAAARMTAGSLREKLAPIFATNADGSKGTEALKGVEKLFGSLFGLMERGGALQLSAPALEGDRAFARWQLEGAERAYARAVAADGNDRRSAFFRGCALFELGRLGEAKVVFGALTAQDERLIAARLMSGLAEPGEGKPLLERARAQMKTIELPKDGDFTLGDPILEIAMGQAMAAGGPMIIPRDSLDGVAAWWPDDPEIHAAIAHCRMRDQQLAAFEAASAKFPDAPLLKAALLHSRLSKARTAAKGELAPLAEEWRKLEPINGIPALLAIHLDNLPKNSASRDPNPYDDVTVAKIEAALALPEFEDHAATLSRAVLRVLDAASHPFTLGATSNSRTFITEWNVIIKRLGDTARARFAAGNFAGGESLCRTLELFGQRLERITKDEVSWLIATVPTISSVEIRKKNLETNGGAPAEIEALKRRLDEFRAARKSRLDPNAVNLHLIPLPSLQRAIVEERLTDKSR